MHFLWRDRRSGCFRESTQAKGLMVRMGKVLILFLFIGNISSAASSDDLGFISPSSMSHSSSSVRINVIDIRPYFAEINLILSPLSCLPLETQLMPLKRSSGSLFAIRFE